MTKQISPLRQRMIDENPPIGQGFGDGQCNSVLGYATPQSAMGQRCQFRTMRRRNGCAYASAPNDSGMAVYALAAGARGSPCSPQSLDDNHAFTAKARLADASPLPSRVRCKALICMCSAM